MGHTTAQIYSLYPTKAPGEWRVERHDGDGCKVAEYIVSRLRPNARNLNSLGSGQSTGMVNVGEPIDWGPRDAKPIFDPPPWRPDDEMDNTIPV